MGILPVRNAPITIRSTTLPVLNPIDTTRSTTPPINSRTTIDSLDLLDPPLDITIADVGEGSSR